ncbi:MAG: hypothetical protein AAFQ94_04150 [Bacteroidota bacterium]
MKSIFSYIILTGFIFICGCTANEQALLNSVFPKLEERYLGQKPPGLIPEKIAPGIVSTENFVEAHYQYTPDMKEFYFSRRGGHYKKTTMYVMQFQEGQWSNPTELTNDPGQYRRKVSPEKADQWKVLKEAPFADIPIREFSVSSKGTYYFYTLNTKGEGYIGYSGLVDGKYNKPQKLPNGINKGIWIAHPFVAPDESYLMWDAETPGKYGADLYISFRQPDGTWGDGISMGDQINTTSYEQGISLTPDGKYLLFWRGDEKKKADGSTYWVGSPYWVDAKIIETLRPE